VGAESIKPQKNQSQIGVSRHCGSRRNSENHPEGLYMKTFLIAIFILILIAGFLLINSYFLSDKISHLQKILNSLSRSKDTFSTAENRKTIDELSMLWLEFSPTAKNSFHGDDVKNIDEYINGLTSSARSESFADYLFYFESLEKQLTLFQEFSSFSFSSVF
jgi:hypothetical protein